jgi:hypothetical protein
VRREAPSWKQRKTDGSSSRDQTWPEPTVITWTSLRPPGDSILTGSTSVDSQQIGSRARHWESNQFDRADERSDGSVASRAPRRRAEFPRIALARLRLAAARRTTMSRRHQARAQRQRKGQRRDGRHQRRLATLQAAQYGAAMTRAGSGAATPRDYARRQRSRQTARGAFGVPASSSCSLR